MCVRVELLKVSDLLHPPQTFNWISFKTEQLQHFQ